MKKLSILVSMLAMLLTTITASSQTVTLSGSGTDPDGSISAYAWRKVSGPAAGVITSPASAITTVTGLTMGVYQYEFSVTDNQGATGLDTVQITVLAGNIKPKANAGQDQIITLPSSATILRGAATAVDGKITAYKWSKLINNSTIIWSPNSPSTAVSNLRQKGKYSFLLKVTDSKGRIGSDTVNVTVNPRNFN